MRKRYLLPVVLAALAWQPAGSALASFPPLPPAPIRAPYIVNLKDFGAAGDTVVPSTVLTATAGSNVLSSSSGIFTADMVGKVLNVPYVGAGGTTLGTIIVGYTSPTQITMANPAPFGVSSISSIMINGSSTATSVTALVGQKLVNAGSAVFTAGMVGQSISIPNAGTSGGTLTSTIATYISPNNVLLADAVQSPVAPYESLVIGTDDTQAWAAAMAQANAFTSISSGHPARNACILVPPGRYLLKSSPALFNGNGCVNGFGSRQSVLVADTSFSGDMLAWAEAWAAVPGAPGPALIHLGLMGSFGSPNQQNAAMLYDRTDNALFDDVDIKEFPGYGIGSGFLRPAKYGTSSGQGFTRESDFRTVRVFRSGTAFVPAVEFASQGSGDGANENNISAMNIYAPMSAGFVTRNYGTGVIRDFKINALRVEGLESGQRTGALVQIGDPTMTGRVGLLTLSDLETISPYPNSDSILIAGANAGGQGPYNINIAGIMLVGGGTGRGLNVQNGRNIKATFASVTTAAPQVTVGPGVTGLFLDGLGAEQGWTYNIDPSSLSGVNTPNWRVGNPALTGAANGNTVTRGTAAADAFGTPAGMAQPLASNLSNAGSFTGAVGVDPITGNVAPKLTVCPGVLTTPSNANVAACGAPLGGTQATAYATDFGFNGVTLPPTSAGAGCNVNDVLTASGGNLNSGFSATQIKITATDGSGVPTAYSVSRYGEYTSLPPDPTTFTGGTCTTPVQTHMYHHINTLGFTPGSGYTASPAIYGPALSGPNITAQVVGIVPTTGSMTVGAGKASVSFGTDATRVGMAGPNGGPSVLTGAAADGTGVRTTLTGSAYTVPVNVSLQRFVQTATIAAQTVNLPTALVDGQALQLVNYSGPITALTFSPAVLGWTNGSQMAAYTSLRVRWDTTSGAWVREQ